MPTPPGPGRDRTGPGHGHNAALTHSSKLVNQPTRHFVDPGCWEDEDGTCDLGFATMTAAISEEPQCVCSANWAKHDYTD